LADRVRKRFLHSRKSDRKGLAGGGLGGVDAPVATFAFLEVDERLEEAGAIEIRPESFGDEDFGVGNLPEKKIADAHFATGADKKIRVGKIGGVEVPRELFLGDGLRGPVAIAFGKDGVHGVDDFGAAAVIEGDREDHPSIAGCLFRGFTRVFLDGRGKFFGATEKAHSDVVFLKEWHFLAQVFAKKLHEEFNFGLGAAPVLNGEGVEREGLDMEARTGFDGDAGGLRASAMSGNAWEMALLGPTAVPVHDDSDVPWEARKIEFFEQRGFFGSDRAEAFGNSRARENMFKRVGHRKIQNLLYAAKLT